MSDDTRTDGEHTDGELTGGERTADGRSDETRPASARGGGADPDDLPDGSGSDGGPTRTAEGGDDDQFQG